MLKLFLEVLKAVFSVKRNAMNNDKKDRSSPVPTNHDKTEQSRNQSTETRKESSKSKLWIVILIIVVFLLIILSITGVVNL